MTYLGQNMQDKGIEWIDDYFHDLFLFWFAEFVESAMYLYQATKDPMLLQMGRDVLTSIETTKTECGYTSVSAVVQAKVHCVVS